MRGAKGICPGVWKSHAPNPGPWGFPTWQETFPGQVVLAGLWLRPSGCSRSVPQFPLLWSRLAPSLPTPTCLPGGCVGCAGVQGAAQEHGGRPGWSAGSWGCLVPCASPQHPPGGPAAATGVCHVAFAMLEGFAVLWSTGDITGSRQCEETQEKRAHGQAVPMSCSSSTGTRACPEPPAQAPKPICAISRSVLAS